MPQLMVSPRDKTDAQAKRTFKLMNHFSIKLVAYIVQQLLQGGILEQDIGVITVYIKDKNLVCGYINVL